jgi:hypothetical protein
MTKQNPNVTGQTTDKSGVMIEIDRAPNGEWKSLGGGERGQWNTRLSDLVIRALPIDQRNAKAVSQAGSAVAAGLVDMKPADPVEGILIAQLATANEAALSLYQRARACPPDHHFEAHTKYLQLADKASRTVAMLTERLDQHRGRGQQQITVKHVTVNADQAVVTDQVLSGGGREGLTAALLPATIDRPMEIIEPMRKEPVAIQRGGSEKK